MNICGRGAARSATNVSLCTLNSVAKLPNSEPKVLDLGQVCQDLKLLRKFRGAAEPKVSQIVLAHSIKYNFGSKM